MVIAIILNNGGCDLVCAEWQFLRFPCIGCGNRIEQELLPAPFTAACARKLLKHVCLMDVEQHLCENTLRQHRANSDQAEVTVHSLSPRGVFTLFLRDKPETDMREIAVLRFLCIGCCERSEQ